MKRTIVQRGLTYCAEKEIFDFLNDKQYLSLIYWARTGETLNLKAPKTFNEKIQWLKLHDRKEIYTKLVDKYEVREYIASVLGDQYLIPLLGLWDNFDSINFDTLPNQFVLKCNHDSGGIIICRDKSSFDYYNAKLIISKCLSRNYYNRSREWPYKNVKPCIIAEKYMNDGLNFVPDDYKVLCFNGKAQLIEVHKGRFSSGHKQDFYNMNWVKTGISQGQAFTDTSDEIIDKPACFEEMIELSERLAKDLIHVRIDWYIIQCKLYFGEITFFDGSGFDRFNNFQDDIMLGDWIKLPSTGI